MHVRVVVGYMVVLWRPWVSYEGDRGLHGGVWWSWGACEGGAVVVEAMGELWGGHGLHGGVVEAKGCM